MTSAARIDELKKRYDENPRRFFAPLANEYRKSGDLELAIAICQQHLAEQPGNMNGHVVYGQALFEAGRYDEAKGTFETALSLDPENLIALRHLGDIARTHGDSEKARGWYARVLDADPRNEEIIAFIADIDATFLGSSAGGASGGATGGAIAAAPVPPVAEAHPEPLGDAVTVKVEAQRPSEVATPVRASTPASPAPAVQVESVATEPTEPTEPAEPPPVAPRPSLSLMDISIDLGASAVEPGATATAGQAAAPGAAPDDLETFDGITFAEMPEPPSALGLDTDAPAADAARLEFDSLDLTMPSAEGAASAESAADIDALFGESPVYELEAAPPPGDTAPAFVTETMAELYLQQGFRSQALDVYTQLAAQQPGDARLRERVRELEAGATPPADAPAPAAIAAPPTGPLEPSSRTARDFFSSLATRRAVKRAGAPSRETVATDAAPPPGVAASPAPTKAADAGVAPGGSLDQFFGGTDVSTPDEAVALAFARIAEGVEIAPSIKGKPTTPASDEFSLDAVFRETPIRPSKVVPRQSEKLRFEQFFGPAGEAAPAAEPPSAPTGPQPGGQPASAPGSPPGPAGEPGSPAELEQFQDWLKQLKKP